MDIENIDELFKHSFVISCNDRRLAYFNIVMKLLGFPHVKHFQAFTPAIYDSYVKNDSSQLNKQERNTLNLFKDFICEYLIKNELWIKSNFEKKYFDNVCKLKYNNNNNYKISYSCMSHLLCIYYAKLNNWSYILIFEDDTFPKKNAYKHVEDAIKYIHKQQALHNEDVNFYLMATTKLIPKTIEKCINYDFVKADLIGICGAYSYILSQKLYDRYIQISILLFLESVECKLSTICRQNNDAKCFYNAACGTIFIDFNQNCFENDDCNCKKSMKSNEYSKLFNDILQSYNKCISNNIIVYDEENLKLVEPNNSLVNACIDKTNGEIIEDKIANLRKVNI